MTANGAGVAGIRVGYYHWVAGEGCQQTNPVWKNLETSSDINGDFKLLTNMLPGNEYAYCIAARQPQGYQQSYNGHPGNRFQLQLPDHRRRRLLHPGYWQRDIMLIPAQAQALEQRRDRCTGRLFATTT